MMSDEGPIDEVSEQEAESVLRTFQLIRKSIRGDLFNYSLFTPICLFMIFFSVYAILLATATGLPERQERIWLFLILLVFVPLTWYSLRRISRALRLRRLLKDDPKQAFLEWEESRFKW